MARKIEPVSVGQSRGGNRVAVTCGKCVERATGIEPAPSVWKTEALPLSYARANAFHSVPEPLGHEVRRLSASRDDLQRAAGAGLRARRAPANLLPHTYRLHLHIVAAGCGAAW